MLHSVLIGLLIILGVIALSTTRPARLKRMARLLHLRYDKYVDNPLTPLAAKSVYLFNSALFQFRQVLTWREPGMFIRLCQMRVHMPMQPASHEEYTLAAVELTRGDFTPFILKPRVQGDTSTHPSLPPQLATRFTLSAPDQFQLPPQVISLLSAGPLCYLETSAYALVYHTFACLPIEQLQPVRLRVQQLANALRHVEPLSAQAAAIASNAADLRAETLLKLHAPATAGGASSGVMKFIYLAVGLTLLIAALWLVQYYLRQWVH